jgi:cytochrome c
VVRAFGITRRQGRAMPLAAFVAIAGACVMPDAARADLIGDAEAGAEQYQDCSGCHQIGKGAEDAIGPHLNGIFGRRAAAHEGFPYSDSMQRAGVDGLTWTLETLDAYIENPRALVSKTRMSYPGLEDAGARADLLAYLRRFSDNPANIPEAAPTAIGTDHSVDPGILAIQGDPEYGEYLSSECVSCHRADGTADGIPSITRWPERDFVVAMHAYKEKLRPHPVMQMMAARLSNEEIAALAAYFRDPD